MKRILKFVFTITLGFIVGLSWNIVNISGSIAKEAVNHFLRVQEKTGFLESEIKKINRDYQILRKKYEELRIINNDSDNQGAKDIPESSKIGSHC